MMAPPPQTAAPAAPPAQAGPAPGSIALAAAPNGALEKVTVLQAQGSGILVKGKNDAQRVVPSVTELTSTAPTQGAKAYYEMMGKIEPCTVTTVHTDAAEAYYTVTLSSGSTRTTEAAHVLVPSVQPAAAPVQASADPFAELTGGGVSANSNGKTAPFQPNDRVLYKPPKGSTLPPEKATVLKVHWDAGDPPYYSIQLDSTGAERQTDAQRLEKFVPDYNAGAAAPPPTLDWPQVQQPAMGFGQPGFAAPQQGYAQQQQGYPPQQFAQQPSYASQQQGFPPQQGYPPQQQFGGGAPAFGGQPQQGFQQQPGFPQQQPGFQQSGFPPQQPGFQQQQQGFPAAPQMQMQQQQPQGGFPGGFPGQGGF